MKQNFLYAAFMMEGLQEAGYIKALKAWDQGCIELVDEMVGYVLFISQLSEAIDAVMKNSRPGVMEYEVVSPFGKWFGEHVIKHGEVPQDRDAWKWILDNMITFYSQQASPAEIEVIKAAAIKASPDCLRCP